MTKSPSHIDSRSGNGLVGNPRIKTICSDDWYVYTPDVLLVCTRSLDCEVNCITSIVLLQ